MISLERDRERERDWLTERDADVAEGSTCDGHVDGKLGVTEGGEEGAETSNGVGDDDSRASVEVAGAAGGDEYSVTNHAAEAKPHQIIPAKSLGHVGAGPNPDPIHLLVRCSDRTGTVC